MNCVSPSTPTAHHKILTLHHGWKAQYDSGPTAVLWAHLLLFLLLTPCQWHWLLVLPWTCEVLFPLIIRWCLPSLPLGLCSSTPSQRGAPALPCTPWPLALPYFLHSAYSHVCTWLRYWKGWGHGGVGTDNISFVCCSIPVLRRVAGIQ